MTRETNSKLVKRHGAFSRVLACLLLGFIVYGTTVEAAHTHGSLARAKSAVGVSTFSDPATDTSSSNSLLGCGDCLICQLHHGFSATLISAAPTLDSATLKSRVFNAGEVLVHSESITRRIGRAPPQISL